jgi:hypothetical protein
MSDLSILIQTKQRFPLRFRYTAAWDSISASLYLPPTGADRKLGIKNGGKLVFVAGDRGQRIRLHQPDSDGDEWCAWLASTAFDIDRATYDRLSAWISATFASNGSGPR